MTFVLTDIEGSTRLLRSLGDGYPDVLERHRSALRRAWDVHGGVEVSTQGDGCLVAFSDARAAIAGCIAAQRNLAATQWPQGFPVRVRMGVHTGLASPRHGDYVALAVHQGARVMSAAHGGLVLVSGRTMEELDPDRTSELEPGSAVVVDGVELVARGRFRLRDFDQPVWLHAAAGDWPVSSRASVRATPADGHNLTRPANSFVGRLDEVASVASLLTPGAFVTITGPGGVGKTRLATEVGVGVASAWSGGVWMTDLAPLSDPSLLPAVLADVLGVATGDGSDPLSQVLRLLEDATALLILDNCERMLDACADLVGAVRARCPDAAVLLTSREPLSVDGERVVRLRTLDVPAEHADIREVHDSPAVQVLLDRARAVAPDLPTGREDVEALVEICRRLDGLPLALELAAKRLATFSPVVLAGDLAHRSRLISSPARDRPQRHRALHDLLDWSYSGLPTEEQAAFRRLAVFGGSFSLDGACVALAAPPVDADAVPDLVWSLVDKSLVVSDLQANATRYRLLETVREFAASHLDADERRRVVEELARWLVDAVGPWHPRDRRWMGAVAEELDTLRVVIDEVAGSEPVMAQTLACTIGRFHDAAQQFTTGITALERLLATLTEPSPERLVMLTTLADLHLRTGAVAAASDAITQADRLAEEVGGPPPWNDAAIERARGDIAMRSGELSTAIEIARRALDAPLSTRGRARMLNLLGIAAGASGDFPAAGRALERELQLHRELSDEAPHCLSLGNLAELRLREGNLIEAARHQAAGLQLALELGQTAMVGVAHLLAAQVALATGDLGTAVVLESSGEHVLADAGWALYPDDHARSAELISETKSGLGASEFDRCWRHGTSLDEAASADLAVRVLTDVAAAPSSAPLASPGATP